MTTDRSDPQYFIDTYDVPYHLAEQMAQHHIENLEHGECSERWRETTKELLEQIQ